MKDDRAFLDSQFYSLRQSLLALADLGGKLSSDYRLAAKLADLSSRLPGSLAESHRPSGVADPVEVLSQTRAALRILAVEGSLGYLEGDGLVSELESVLDGLEQLVGRDIRKRLTDRTYGLYVIIDPEITGGRDPFEVARGALEGGARMLQLRDKTREKGQTLPLARKLKKLCGEYDALMIVNDHADLAALVGSDGLHVGQGDLPVGEARRVLKPQQIIGRSNHLVEEVLESQTQGADHVALGAIYPTTTKASIIDRAPTGTEAIRKVKEAVKVPLVAIGGINQENVAPVVAAGADAICVSSAVGLAPDPEEAARRLVERIISAGGRA